MPPPTAAPLSHRQTLRLAAPIVLAQLATATTGVVDTAVMGRFGSAADLAAVGVASVTFSFVYWAFGFLRMSTTALTAQADGAGDQAELQAALLRALVVGASAGAVIIALRPFVAPIAMAFFDAASAVEQEAAAYIHERILGAPAALMGYAVTGWLLGRGQTRRLLVFQLVLNGTNAALDAWFVVSLDRGPAGIGLGTAIAEWVALIVGISALVLPGWQRGGTSAAVLWDGPRWRALFAANRDVLIRTLALLGGFAWFTNAGARVGTAALAGNEVLMQFVAVSAFVLDSFAYVAQREVGLAWGRADERAFGRAVRVTSTLAVGAAIMFSALFLLTGPAMIRAAVADGAARDAALRWLPWCAAVPTVGVASWQLDGVFLGTMRGPALRNAAIVASALYVCTDLLLRPAWGNTGVWAALLALYAYRALTLLAYWPGLRAALSRLTVAR